MGRKQFETVPYDPISAELMRNVTRDPAAPRAGEAVPSVAVAPVAPSEIPASASTANTVALTAPSPSLPTSRTGITKRFLLSREEDEALTGFLHRLELRAKTKVTVSAFVRSFLHLAMQSEAALVEELDSAPRNRLPSNHDAVAWAAFEEWWAQRMARAFRRTPGARSGR